MVTDSKQAKAAVAIMLIILIFAVAFIALNFKGVHGTLPNSFNWDLGDCYDFSTQKFFDDPQNIYNTGGNPDVCFAGWSSKPTHGIRGMSNARVYNSGSNQADCTAVSLDSYTATDKDTTFSHGQFGCVKTSDGKFYSIKISIDQKNNTLGLMEWQQSTELICDDGEDNDQDKLIDCKDPDCKNKVCGSSPCPAGSTGTILKTCEYGWIGGGGYSCYYPGARGYCNETDCTDGKDNDGDTLTDCADPDCADDPACEEEGRCTKNGETRSCGPETEVGECKKGIQTCKAGSWGDCVGAVYPADEICDNGKDDDCDGLTDAKDIEDCGCKTGETRSCYSGDAKTIGIGICKSGNQTCTDGIWGDCEGEITPGKETCNEKDDDCDGVQDNVNGKKSINATKCACYNGAKPAAKEDKTNGIDDDCDGELAPEETDEDGDGFTISDDDCDDENPKAYPGATELCSGNVDEDCDGKINNGCNVTQSTISQTVGKTTQPTAGSALPTQPVLAPPAKEPSNAGLYGGILAIILIIIGVLLYWFYFKPKKELANLTIEHSVHEPAEATQADINSYIKNTLSLGYSPEQIKDALVAKGWDEETVNDLLSGSYGGLTALGQKAETAKPEKPAKKTTKRKTQSKRKSV